MEDLKENTQKKNMKKLVLSAALGMFCYCSNNVTMGMKTQPNKQQNIPRKEADNEQEVNNNISPNKEQHDQTGENNVETIPLLNDKKENNSQEKKEIKGNKEPAKTEEQDEECSPSCCCREETKPKEEGEVIKKSGDITVKEDINQKEMRPIIRDGNDNSGGETK